MAHVENYYESRGFGSKVNCAKCGRYTPRRQLVRDGYTLAKVCSDCYDPPERPDPHITDINPDVEP